MGQLETLTALALGRGHYEDEVVWNSEPDKVNFQRYNSRGYPKHPETKRRERDHIRAANEVMQVTGVVEDTAAARVKSNIDEADKQLESFIGFRLIEVGRACLDASVWGVLGLRRRILLYRPYTNLKVNQILVKEKQRYSITHLMFSGLPMALIPQASDYLFLAIEKFIDFVYRPVAIGQSPLFAHTKFLTRRVIMLTFSYLKSQFILFSILQQLNLLPHSKLLPDALSLIPFTTKSLIQFNPNSSTGLWKFCSLWVGALFQTILPLVAILGYKKIQVAVSEIIYRYIFTILPRPTGPSLLAGLPIDSPTIEYDSADQILQSNRNSLPSVPQASTSESEAHSQNMGREGSDEEDYEMNHAHLISFDVEPTESPDNSRGPWSAELRSANESKSSGVTRFRVTGLTLLPIILATEGLIDIVSDILVMPIEALMVRTVGTVYRVSANLCIDDQYDISLRPRGFVNLLVTWTLQLTITGVVWGGFTMCTNWYATQRQRLLHDL